MEKKYGTKTRLISILCLIFGFLFLFVSIVSLLLNEDYFEGFIAMSSIFLFLGSIIYVVIYRQFVKLEKIAEEIENKG